EPVDDVRVHTDAAAGEVAAAHDANAVTSGQDIYFADGAYQPQSPQGLVRILHETAHAAQQRGSEPADQGRAAAQEAEVDHMVATGEGGPLTRSAAGALCEPTYPRRTTGFQLIREAERVLTMKRDTASGNPTTKMWSNVSTNFGDVTAGSIARRIWTHIFARHFTEPDPRGGVESVHPRYFYSRTYGWVDGQHFFGFIDYAERFAEVSDFWGDTRTETLEEATAYGFGIETKQQKVRDYVVLQRSPDYGDDARIMQVRPPNTPLFRAPVAAAAGMARAAALKMASATLSGPEGELFGQFSEPQKDKFLEDNAKSAWTFEDPVSNQLGIRFYFQHGERINRLPVTAREGEFRNALVTFFASIGVVDDQAEVDKQAQTLPARERYNAPHTTEDRERKAHPELYRLP
ncbi:MAG TPA: DUF4157 domain-containing protein, partial [Dermatophilaceae bacterium]